MLAAPENRNTMNRAVPRGTGNKDTGGRQHQRIGFRKGHRQVEYPQKSRTTGNLNSSPLPKRIHQQKRGYRLRKERKEVRMMSEQ